MNYKDIMGISLSEIVLTLFFIPVIINVAFNTRVFLCKVFFMGFITGLIFYIVTLFSNSINPSTMILQPVLLWLNCQFPVFC